METPQPTPDTNSNDEEMSEAMAREQLQKDMQKARSALEDGKEKIKEGQETLQKVQKYLDNHGEA